MNTIFHFSKNSANELRCGNCLARSTIHSTHLGIESIKNIGTNIWNKIPYVTVFKSKIENEFRMVSLED